MKESLRLVLLIAIFAAPVAAQEKFHVFPQIADGVFSDGTYYKSTFMIYPWFDTDSPDCNLRLYGLSVTLGSGRSNSFTINFTPGQYYVTATNAAQGFSSGYATLTCSEYVFANVLYTFYAPGGAKLSEATVFSAGDEYSVKMLLDHREGARLGVAIANNTDISKTYRLTLGTRTATFAVPARTALAKFADELISIPANATGLLKVEATDFSYFSAIGLRFTGPVFTTIPAQ